MALLSGLLLSACSVIGVRTTAEPKYQVVDRVGPAEIRAYGPRLAAETLVGGGEVAARGAGFQKLAGYIFGANQRREKIDMTAPVSRSPGPETIAMTAPVDQSQGADGRWRIRFFMPPGYTADTVPVPTDPAVRIATVPPQTVAVLRYSGTTSAAAVRSENARLLQALGGGRWRAAGAPMAWFYDPPWTLPPLRRNEAVVPVEREP